MGDEIINSKGLGHSFIPKINQIVLKMLITCEFWIELFP